MQYSYLFAAVLILVSGFIAYFGDMLGRWMGKKRLTLGRLRPRHTAYIVTAITGMLISAMAVVTLLAISSEFRKVFTQGQQILAQNLQLSTANTGLVGANKSLKKLKKELEAKVKAQQKEVEEAAEAVLKAAEIQVKAKAMVALLEKDIAARKAELETLKKSSRATKAELEAKTSQLDGARAELETAQKSLAAAQSSVAAATKRVAGANTKLAETNAKLQETERTLGEQRQKIAQQETDIREQTAYLRELDKQKRELEFKANYFEQLRKSGDFRIRQGDEIARGTVSPRQSTIGIRSDLYSILDSASDAAKKLGAGVGDNGRAVVVMFPKVIGLGDKETERDRIEGVKEQIALSGLQNDDVIVQVICAENTLAGEQAPAWVTLYRNKIVFLKGDLIAETEMNGRASEGRVLLSVINFLQGEVSVAGLKAGIIPVANPNPRTSLGADRQTQVEGLMSVVDQITSKNSRVKVEAFACADVYAAGPLNMTNMRFSVTKL